MGQPDDAAALHDHYALGRERDRLDAAVGVVEFERTTELLGLGPHLLATARRPPA